MYIKEFEQRSEEKKETHESEASILYPKERQVWYMKRWVNIGFESDGKWEFLRPILVMKRIGAMYFCVPLTTKHKDNRFHYLLDQSTFNKTSSVMLSQARVVDVKRFTDHIWTVNKTDFKQIKKLMREMYLP